MIIMIAILSTRRFVTFFYRVGMHSVFFFFFVIDIRIKNPTEIKILRLLSPWCAFNNADSNNSEYEWQSDEYNNDDNNDTSVPQTRISHVFNTWLIFNGQLHTARSDTERIGTLISPGTVVQQWRAQDWKKNKNGRIVLKRL